MRSLQRFGIVVALSWAVLAGSVSLVAAEDGAGDKRAQEAAGEQPETAAESRSAAFQAVEGKPSEQVPGGPLLVGAYAFILVVLVVYVARLGALHAKNRGELDRLTRALERGQKG